MRVFDLKCAHAHRFEGWFASKDAFDDQLSRGLVACPLCSSIDVERVVSAPHLNLSSLREPSRAALSPEQREAASSASSVTAGGGMSAAGGRGRGDDIVHRDDAQDRRRNVPSPLAPLHTDAGAASREAGLTPEAALAEALQRGWLTVVREVIQRTENVGDAFAEEARRIHYREAPERAIRGTANAEQVAELIDEGIEVMALPLPDAAKGTLQ